MIHFHGFQSAILALALLLGQQANAAVRRFELDITADFANPDCHQAPYPALRVNGQFPAPTLRVVKGDDVEVVVHNSAYALNVSTTVHFHGIRQYGTVESDGVPDVTQAAIPPGQSFTHRFRVIDQIGTYFYHAHQGMQDDTVQGALIVHDDERSMPPEDHADCGLVEGPYLYYGERTLQLSEWWHQSFVDREEYYMSKHFIYDKGADSILLNGRTVHQDNHNSSLEMSTKNVCPGYSAINVEPNQTYRLRIIGAHTFRTLGVAIEQHNMTVIEADGELTKPYEVDWLEIGPGQRFSVLIHTGDMKAGDENVFPIATSYRWRHRPSGGHTENGFAYLRYTNNLKQEDETLYKPVLPGRNGKELAESMHYPSYTLADGLPVFPNENILDWFWPEIAPLDDSTGTTLLNAQADRVIKLRSTSVKRPNNETRYLMNDRAPISRQRPVLTDVLERHIHTDMVDKENDGFSLDLHTFPIKMGEVVDIVLQNTKAGRNCLIHPWHTHGHSHYMIASGPGEYVHETHADVRNYPTPLFRDVSMVYPTDTEESGGCGWSKIRIYADNPGVWALHCHITSHMMQGKFAVLEESPELIEKYRLYRADYVTHQQQ